MDTPTQARVRGGSLATLDQALITIGKHVVGPLQIDIVGSGRIVFGALSAAGWPVEAVNKVPRPV